VAAPHHIGALGGGRRTMVTFAKSSPRHHHCGSPATTRDTR